MATNIPIQSDSGFNPIVGEGFSEVTQRCIRCKQKLIAKNNHDTISYFNNNPPWIKVASSVRVVGNSGRRKLQTAGVGTATLMDKNLAQNFVLFSELGATYDTYTLTPDLGNAFKKAGIAGFGGKGLFTSVYGFGELDFGLVPTAGITDMTVETLGDNGSIKKATINITAYNKVQFNILELLYMRLGYHVLIEWGKSKHLTKDCEVVPMYKTALEQYWFDDQNFPDVSDDGLHVDLLNSQINILEKIAVVESYMEVAAEEAGRALEGSFTDRVLAGSEAREAARQYDIYQLVKDRFNAQLDTVEDKIETLMENYLEWFTYNFKQYRERGCDYDGMIGRVSNFNWTVGSNGEYKIKIEVLSGGDLLQSLTVNSNQNIVGPNELTITVQGTNPLGVTKSTGDLAKVLNNIATFTRGYTLPEEEWLIQASEGTPLEERVKTYGVASVDLSEAEKFWFELQNNAYYSTLEGLYFGFEELSRTENVTDDNATEYYLSLAENSPPEASYTNGFIKTGDPFNDAPYDPKIFLNNIDVTADIMGADRLQDIKPGPSGSRVNPDSNSNYGFFQYTRNNVFEVLKVKSKGNGAAGNAFYMSMHYYLSILQEIVIPKNGIDGYPAVRLMNERGKYRCNTHPLQLSSDPTKIVISKTINIAPYFDTVNDVLLIATGSSGTKLDILQDVGFYQYNLKENDTVYGDIMNIYLNMNWLAQLATDGDADEYGNINFIKHISNLCKGINDSLGNINQIDFAIDNETNQAYFFDRTCLIGLEGLLDKLSKPKTPFLFNVNGFIQLEEDGVKNIHGSIIQDYNLNSQISPETAAQMTIGSQAIGASGGYDMTAFSTWNKGLEDRLLPKKYTTGFSGDSPILNSKRLNSLLINFLNNAKRGYKIEIYDDMSRTTKIVPKAWWEVLTGIITTGAVTSPTGPLNKREFIWDMDSTKIQGVDPTAFGPLGTIQKTLLYEMFKNVYKETNFPTPISGFIPLDLQLKFEGNSNINLFQSYTIPTKFLPATYPNAMRFIVKKITNKIDAKGWETQLNSFSIPGGVTAQEQYIAGLGSHYSGFNGGTGGGATVVIPPTNTPTGTPPGSGGSGGTGTTGGSTGGTGYTGGSTGGDYISIAMKHLKEFEGYDPNAYADPPGSGNVSIGIGTDVVYIGSELDETKVDYSNHSLFKPINASSKISGGPDEQLKRAYIAMRYKITAPGAFDDKLKNDYYPAVWQYMGDNQKAVLVCKIYSGEKTISGDHYGTQSLPNQYYAGGATPTQDEMIEMGRAIACGPYSGESGNKSDKKADGTPAGIQPDHPEFLFYKNAPPPLQDGETPHGGGGPGPPAGDYTKVRFLPGLHFRQFRLAALWMDDSMYFIDTDQPQSVQDNMDPRNTLGGGWGPTVSLQLPYKVTPNKHTGGLINTAYPGKVRRGQQSRCNIAYKS